MADLNFYLKMFCAILRVSVPSLNEKDLVEDSELARAKLPNCCCMVRGN